jgi:hypothetical protein
MNQRDTDPETIENWRPKVLLIGAVIGAVVGVGAAYLFAQNADRKGVAPEITPGEGVRLGLLVMGLLRSVATLGEGEKS